MSKAAIFFYALVAYAIFFATFLYLVAFVGDFGFVPRTVDRGPEAPTGLALVANLVLISIFGLQHSVMARQGFKRAWTRLVPPQAERSTFVLFASFALIILFAFWRPIDTIMWDVQSAVGQAILWTIFGIGWVVVLLSTFLINHFELFGLQQAWLHVRGRQTAAPVLREPFLYRWVRHPLYLGFFLAFWAIPQMTAGHLLLAVGMSVYMLIAIGYEERDLIGLFGRDYEQYRARVGMLAPRFRRRA
jgi:protein-S-isoprenylcysteine O-methyltransferase Ste14